MAAPSNVTPTARQVTVEDPTSLQRLLSEDEEVADNMDVPGVMRTEWQGMTRSQASNLYTSHFLSTWNMRTYEFAVVIFTAAAYPETLIAASIRGIVRNLANICFSSAVGRAIDKAPDRFEILIYTILANRVAVIGASTIWYFLLLGNNSNVIKAMQFACILSFGVIEAVSANGNMLAMERDWVPALKAPDGQPYDLTNLNAVMRRIDLICKLAAPIFISTVISLTGVRTGAAVVGCMSAVSWGLEYWCARRVWLGNAQLRVPKVVRDPGGNGSSEGLTRWQKLALGLKGYGQGFKNYFGSSVWIPSMSLALLHMSLLSYGAVFITYLLSVGYSLELITIARAAGSLVEISSTVVTPVGVKLLGKAHDHGGRYQQIDEERDDEINDQTILNAEDRPQKPGRTETGLERLGLWGISWQLINLVPVVFALWSMTPQTPSTAPSNLLSRFLSSTTAPPIAAITLFFFLSLSRLGLWIYDLTTQQLTQTLIAPSQRSSFSGVEYSFVSIFEMTQLVSAIIFSRPDQFKWLALGSLLGLENKRTFVALGEVLEGV
ncbi:hypothetical protein BP5796_00098 [Coleophoma crateriformis]|uniref:Solute carrier family 40 member n=1 Tax=Coleophoma crateriformis TaxID=565419 RepID=A0A3D8T706_9HELO|nr:hypothetical protein BP5796_00098 [Coleophoma crateriformis]